MPVWKCRKVRCEFFKVKSSQLIQHLLFFQRTQDWPAYLNCQENANKPRRNWFVFDLILNLEYLKSMPFFYELDIEDQVSYYLVF